MAQIPMTDQEVKIALDALSDQIDKYAELLVKKGCAISEGSQLVINAQLRLLILPVGFSEQLMRLAQNLSQLFGGDQESSRIMYENVDLARLSRHQAGRLSSLTPLQSRVQHFCSSRLMIQMV